MSSEGGHYITEPMLDALRNGHDQEVFSQIFESCLRWARRRGNLPEEAYVDIVSESIAEELDTLRLRGLNADEVWKRLRRALDRHRKRAIRMRRREVELKDFNEALVAFNGVEAKIDAAHMLEVTRLLRGFISLSLDSLSDRDYALLYERYNLQVYGINPREQMVSLEDLTPGARKTALSRARVHLLNELERRLAEAGTCLDKDRLVVRDALRLIRSGAVLRNDKT